MSRLLLHTSTIALLFALCLSLRNGSTVRADVPGTVVTLAGTGASGLGGEKISALKSPLSFPRGLAYDHKDRLNVVDVLNHRIRRVGPKDKIVTAAGSGGSGAGAGGFGGDGQPANRARLNEPQGLASDADDNLLIADSQNHRVRMVDAKDNVTTIAGTGPAGAGKGGFGGDGKPATQALLNQPAGLTLDPQGNLYIADTGNHRVRRVDGNGVITTAVGNGTTGTVGDGGPATGASLTAPGALAFDGAGNLYISDTAEHVVRKVDSKGIITTAAGTGKPGFSGDGGLAVQAQLNRPDGLAVDTEGSLYIADTLNHRVRKMDAKGMMSTVVGNGKPVFAEEGGLAGAVGLRGPVAVLVDGKGNLIISDTGFFADPIDKLGPGERVLQVSGIAAPGLVNGRPF